MQKFCKGVLVIGLNYSPNIESLYYGISLLTRGRLVSRSRARSQVYLISPTHLRYCFSPRTVSFVEKWTDIRLNLLALTIFVFCGPSKVTENGIGTFEFDFPFIRNKIYRLRSFCI